MSQGWAAILMSAALAQGAADEKPWSLPDERFGVRTAPVLLLSRPDVQAELALSPKQIRQSEKAIRRLWEQAYAVRDQPNDLAGQRVREALNEAQERWISESLSGVQQARLREIERQWEGPSILLTRQDIIKRLGITSTQQRAVTSAISAYPYTLEGRDATAKAVRDVLGESQRGAWDALWGRSFAFKSSSPAPQDPAVSSAGGVPAKP